MIKITESIRNLMNFDSTPSISSKFVEEKLGEIDFDFALGISGNIISIDEDIIKIQLSLGSSPLRNVTLIRGEETYFVPDVHDVAIKYTFFLK